MLELDRTMQRILGTDHPFLEELNRHIMAGTGKRLRPTLLVLCAKMLEFQSPNTVLYAAVFELIHTATLIHDDIIDQAEVRRGRETLNNRLDNTITVLYGDLLYTKAHSTAIEAGRLDVLGNITWVSERMIEGELLQNKVNFNADISESDYFDILQRKTAYLFGGTTKAAGQMADRSAREIDALFDFGFNFGVSFQLVDDLLDYTGNTEEMGKPVLKDLREGKVTLPLIRLLAKAENKHLPDLIRTFWDHPEADLPDALLDALHGGGTIEETRELAETYAEKAAEALNTLPKNDMRTLLQTLPTALLTRTK